MAYKYTEVKLCDFNKVELSIPRLRLVKLLFKKTYLTQEETHFLRVLLWKSESAENKILHIKSIIEKTLFKSASPLK